MSTTQTCGRSSVVATLLLLFSFLFNRAAAAPEPVLSEEALNTTLEISSLRLVSDSDCVGYEGQWNCLSDKFQHCAAGKWSAVLSCNADSGSTLDGSKSNVQDPICTPLGRTDLVEFQGECNAAWGYGGGGWGGGGGGGGRGTVCSGNGCYYGKGSNLTVDKWVYVVVAGVVALGFL